ncbi:MULTISPECIES: protein-glutamate methylesterase/protein-glutamine glutaminase [Methanosarcina]|nr:MULTISPECIES: chemotaxis response regulator protein-glutamate methylesterase [Methanosarcina]KKG06824.1 chemotaxis protein CheY [Methanosarcina mazei]KKG07463.1 chemotaxis protein CheY [Methanosarcina mazei]KKG33239.1 chemotaxis protein CheY [Methanosarcina mazei]KKG38176.1 chemotaxis protein CheY [Methanosarcina mazei]KKG71806.1 chemotaxis protein CheY [Methanosarcina mazei]
MVIRALIVDDSALIRKVLSDILNQDPKIAVIGTAINGEDGLEKVRKLKPDVVLLDNIMPVLDGLKTLSHIMEEFPTPVVIVSALGEKAEEITLTALEYGAVDVIEKPSGILSQSMHEMAEEICAKVRAASKADLNNLGCIRDLEHQIPENHRKKKNSLREKTFVRNVLAIGASTGGPRALEKLIGSFPAEIPAAVLIVQHMPPGFTASLSKRLDAKSALRVKEAQEGDIMEEGTVFIAPGDYHMEIVRNKVNGFGEDTVHLSCGPKELGSRPSVNVLFRSVARIYGPRVISLVLTGMNCDGADGAEEIKKMGGKVIAEDQSSCVIYGMPGEIVRRNLADFVLPLDKMADEIVKIVR